MHQTEQRERVGRDERSSLQAYFLTVRRMINHKSWLLLSFLSPWRAFLMQRGVGVGVLCRSCSEYLRVWEWSLQWWFCGVLSSSSDNWELRRGRDFLPLLQNHYVFITDNGGIFLNFFSPFKLLISFFFFFSWHQKCFLPGRDLQQLNCAHLE